MGEICYKGFEKGLVCRGKQYKENTVFEEEKATICRCGMHYCKNPFDVLDYYDLVNEKGEMNDFSTVEPLGEELTDDGKKFCTKTLRIGAKLSFKGFVKACVDFAIEKTSFSFPTDKVDTGDYAKIGSSGNYAKIGSSGNSAQIDSTGADSVVMCAGLESIAKAKKGSWITLAEWDYSNEKGRYVPKCVKTEQVDGVRIKEDTFYQLINGEFEEV